MYITFIDGKNNREWSYDDVECIDFKYNVVHVVCHDGFQTRIRPEEYTKIELSKDA